MDELEGEVAIDPFGEVAERRLGWVVVQGNGVPVVVAVLIPMLFRLGNAVFLVAVAVFVVAVAVAVAVALKLSFPRRRESICPGPFWLSKDRDACELGSPPSRG